MVKSFENKGLKIYHCPRMIFKRQDMKKLEVKCVGHTCAMYLVHVIVILGM
jgi:hypothetical protein